MHVRLPDVSESSDSKESDFNSSSDDDVSKLNTDSDNDSVLSFEAPSLTSLSSSSSESSDTEGICSGENEPSTDKSPSNENEEQPTNLQDPKTYMLNRDNIDYNIVSWY